jgi:hypothetical protein
MDTSSPVVVASVKSGAGVDPGGRFGLADSFCEMLFLATFSDTDLLCSAATLLFSCFCPQPIDNIRQDTIVTV